MSYTSTDSGMSLLVTFVLFHLPLLGELVLSVDTACWSRKSPNTGKKASQITRKLVISCSISPASIRNQASCFHAPALEITSTMISVVGMRGAELYEQYTRKQACCSMKLVSSNDMDQTEDLIQKRKLQQAIAVYDICCGRG